MPGILRSPRYARLSIPACLALAALAAANATAQPSAAYQSPAELAAQLRQMQSALDANPSALPADMPDHWNVATSDGRYSISSEPLRALAGKDRAPAARQWLDRMAAELESYSAASQESSLAARARLNRILARREFSSVHPPGAWDLFRQRVMAWILSLLESLFGAAGEHIGAERVLFWILMAGAVALIAKWLIGFWRRADPRPALSGAQPNMAARGSATWLRQARQAAAHGHWREAIHAAYWAGIARLQESRALAEDRTRTPREYFRLIPAEQPASRPLRALTVSLERFWYAGQTAGSTDFDESLKHLEALGCRED